MTKGRDADFPTVTSDTSIASIAGFNGPSFGACAVRGFRGAGVADTNAARTVRRCTPCRSARARIERSSRRASRRIASNSSALLDPNGPPHHRRPIIQVAGAGHTRDMAGRVQVACLVCGVNGAEEPVGLAE